jgi:hypothetical protein
MSKKSTRAVWRALVKLAGLKIPYQYRPENKSSEIVMLIFNFVITSDKAPLTLGQVRKQCRKESLISAGGVEYRQ